MTTEVMNHAFPAPANPVGGLCDRIAGHAALQRGRSQRIVPV